MLRLVTLVCLAAVLSPVLALWSCSSGSSPANLETVTFGTLVPNEIAGLVYIARDRGFFAKNGLDVIIRPYDTGVTVTDAVVRGEIDLGLSSEFPFLAKAFAKEPVSMVGVIDRFSYSYLFARKDAGIANIPALKGKRIGSARGTITDFYIGRFLELNGMSISDVDLINVAPSQLVEAIGAGSVDAIIAWGTFAQQIVSTLGSQVTQYQVQAGQASYGVVSARNAWITSHPQTLDRFLKALVQAEQSAARDPAAARAIIQKQMGYDDAAIRAAWPEHDFSVTLDQSLILAMEDEARWMIGNNMTAERTVPDSLEFIHADSLKSVKPGAVRISGK